MIRELLEMYSAGKLTAHHTAVECLNMLNPVEPGLVMAQLPSDILAAIKEFTQSYHPQGMKTNYGVLPAQDQVAAAAQWIRENKTHVAR